ncbi:MAG: hypothetical protein ACRENZ_05495, partial [Thermodesulfobacteriota bacterium]
SHIILTQEIPLGEEMKTRNRFVSSMLVLLLIAITGCAFASGAAIGTAAGFAGGYILRDHGYEIRDPIVHE